MTKQIIATVVAGIILFLWQFLSWSTLPVHQSEFGHTPNQDSIMEVLSRYLVEEGSYMVPGVEPGTGYEEATAAMEKYVGKPWAIIQYHESLNMAMGMNMVRGFAVDLLAAFLLIWLLMKIPGLNLMTAVQASLAVGIIGYLTIPYLNSVWFETNSFGYLVDAIVQWGLVGVWLGWWLPRR